MCRDSDDLGFTEVPDNERISLRGIESYEEDMCGDTGGYMYPEVDDL